MKYSTLLITVSLGNKFTNCDNKLMKALMCTCLMSFLSHELLAAVKSWKSYLGHWNPHVAIVAMAIRNIEVDTNMYFLVFQISFHNNTYIGRGDWCRL